MNSRFNYRLCSGKAETIRSHHHHKIKTEYYQKVHGRAVHNNVKISIYHSMLTAESKTNLNKQQHNISELNFPVWSHMLMHCYCLPQALNGHHKLLTQLFVLWQPFWRMGAEYHSLALYLIMFTNYSWYLQCCINIAVQANDIEYLGCYWWR